jgi:hypothetical protein
MKSVKTQVPSFFAGVQGVTGTFPFDLVQMPHLSLTTLALRLQTPLRCKFLESDS